MVLTETIRERVESVVQTTDGEGNVTRYTYDEAGRPVKVSLIDEEGSTVNVLDSSGNRVVSYWYRDFGEAVEDKASGCANNPINYVDPSGYFSI